MQLLKQLFKINILVSNSENIKKILEPRPCFNHSIHSLLSNSVLFQHNMAYITTLLFPYSLLPPSRRVQSIYCCFILSQTHPVITLASLVQHSTVSYPPLQLLTLARQGISCRELSFNSPALVPHPKGSEVEWGHTQGVALLLFIKVSTSSRFILG